MNACLIKLFTLVIACVVSLSSAFAQQPKQLVVKKINASVGVDAKAVPVLLDKNQVEYQALPRMAALAEVQWTSGKKDYQAFLKRLNRLVSFYELYKLTYAKHLWPDRITSPWEYN